MTAAAAAGPTLVTDLGDALAKPLALWLDGQRWFAGKGRAIQAVRTIHSATIQDGEPQLEQLLIEVDQGDSVSLYQVLVGVRRSLPEYLEHGLIAAVPGPYGTCYAYDAVYDPDLAGRLVELIGAGASTAELRFATEPGAEVVAGLTSRPIDGEQSNTSLVFANRYILKLFRRMTTGVSPDLELHRALAAAGCAHVATPLGSIEGELGGEPITYGMLQEFLANAADGWAMATASVRDLIGEADLYAAEVGGDFAAESFRLGEAVAAVHADLRRTLGGTDADPGALSETVKAMHRRLDAVLATVPELRPYEAAIQAVFDDLATADEPMSTQRVHGDLHLGQVLRTVAGWVLIDFEGEPARPLAERTAYASPLRDVAGMLRSFDYAARHLLAGREPDGQLEYRAAEWAGRNRTAFCAGYAQASSAGGGADPREHPLLVRALELDKAVYEVAYEHGNRPGWLPIPLASVDRLTRTEPAATPAGESEEHPR